MSDQTRCFMPEITDERLKGKWDIVVNKERYVSVSSIRNQGDISYSGMVHLSNSDFEKLWALMEKITPNMYYNEVHQILVDSNLDGILEPLIMSLKDLLNNKMDYN